MNRGTVDLIIPVYKPDGKFDLLLERISRQTVKPEHTILLLTLDGAESKRNLEGRAREMPGVSIHTLERERFDHGGTRNWGASLSEADYLLFMTQDAVPADEYLVARLLDGFSDEKTAAVYGRQLPAENAGAIEKYTRSFNYPPKDLVKSREDISRLGIKTYFCSNVCAMYRRESYLRLGGFVMKTIFNEDSILAAEIIKAGQKIVYASEAMVIHSHQYSYWQQLTRNFDLGVSHSQYRDVFKAVPPGSEGLRLVKSTLRYLMKEKKWLLIPDLIAQSGFKLFGYKLGGHYDKLPRCLVKKLSMNKAYWNSTNDIK